nr:retrovirus-related Pol polyprotein from transposon TNT 1-94 [Tanacetum cinerariifolium]
MKSIKAKKERIKSIGLKAKKESSDDETSTSGSDDEEYAIAVRKFKKFFRRKGIFVRQPREERKSLRQRDEKKGKSDWKCFRSVIQVISLAIVQKHLATKIKKLSLEVLGAIARMTPKTKPTTKVVAWLNHQMSLKIINKNKILKTKRDLLEKEILKLNVKIKRLKKSKEIEMACKSCDELKLENAKLNETQVKFVKFDKSANSLREMLNNQKSPSCKIGLVFNSDKASTSETKTMSFVGSSAKKVTNGSTIKGHGSTLPGSVSRKDSKKGSEHGFSPPMSSRSDFVITRKKLIHNSIDESKKPSLKPSLKSSIDVIRKNTKIVNTNNEEDKSIEVEEIVNIKESKNHPLDQVIENLKQRTLRSQAQNHSNFYCFISTIEPKNVNEALKDENWVVAMQEELNQFIANDVWELVPLPLSQSIIGTKWIFRNKLDENGIVSRNKARLVAQGYNKQEGIDYDETYAPIARLESIRIVLAIAYANDFKLYQMDVKSAFLNGFINEEVYVAQPLGFINFQKPNYVYKLKKALYGLKQAPKAWYIKEMLKKFGLEDSKPTKTLMSTEIKLTKGDEADFVDSSKYRGEIATLSNQMDYKRTKDYLPRVHRSRQMDEELRDSYHTLEKRLLHEERIVTPSFIAENNMLPLFQAIGFEHFLTLNEPICPRFVVEFYHSLEVKRNELDIRYIEFKLGQFTFTLTPSRLSQILKTLHALETFYTSEWSLNSLDDHSNSNYFGNKHDII